MARQILVVDDSRTVRRVVRLVLEPAGFQVHEAADGAQGLELLGRQAFDLILLDFVLPGMNGYEFSKQLRARPGVGSTPVILMSAKADSIGARFVRQTGALDAIAKPFAPDVLRAVVDHVLARSTANLFSDEGTIVQEALGLLDREDLGHREEVSEVAFLPRPNEGVTSPDVTSVGMLTPPPDPDFARAPATSTSPGSDDESDALTARALQPLLVALGGMLRPGLDPQDPQLALHAAQQLDASLLRNLRSQLALVPSLYRGKLGFEGALERVPLAEVFQLLRLQMQSGVLIVENGRAVIDVAFRAGNVQLAIARNVASEFLLGRYLVAAKALQRAVLDKAVVRLRSARKGWLGEALVAEGLVTREQLEAALQQQTSELVYELLRWETGRYRFETSTGFPEAERADLGLPIEALLLEGYRRVDEWRLIQPELPSFDLVLVRDDLAIDKLPAGRVTPEERRILDAVDGHRTVRAVVEHLALNSFDVAKVLYRCLRSRLLRRRGG